MFYNVKYKKINQWFWRTLKNVKGDGVVEGLNARYFILLDETRVEIPSSCVFEFSQRRFDVIKSTMEKEVGQPITTNDGRNLEK